MLTHLSNPNNLHCVRNLVDVAVFERLLVLVKRLNYQPPWRFSSSYVDCKIAFQVSSALVFQAVKTKILLQHDIFDRGGLLKRVDSCKKLSRERFSSPLKNFFAALLLVQSLSISSVS